jgi:phosphohistidine phosphatase
MNSENKILYLVRHAKAEKSSLVYPDIDRPLAEAGIEESYRMANQMRTAGEMPEIIISSPATRAIATALVFKRTLGLPDQKLLLDQKLYDIHINDFLIYISDLNDEYKTVMIVGHNPSFTQFAFRMDSSISHLPTASIIKFCFQASKWNHASYLNADNRMFIVP